MRKICLKIIALFACFLSICGIIGFVSGFLVSFGVKKIIPDTFEMPLGDLKGIAVDSEGNIYCGAQFYSRVQVYNIEGKFLYGKCFDSSGGAFKIKINEKDQLEVMTFRGHRRLLFSREGTLLNERSNVSTFKVGFENVNDKYCFDEKRNIEYQIKPILLPFPKSIPLFGSHIIKKESSGKEIVIINTPFYKWLLMGPFPGFLFMFIGFPIYSIVLGKKIKIRLLFWEINKDSRKINSIDDLKVDEF